MSKSDFPLVPVLGQAGCAGHLLRCARGFRAFDSEDRPLGYFADLNRATQAVLNTQLGDKD